MNNRHDIMLPTNNPSRSAVQRFVIDVNGFNVLKVDRIDDEAAYTKLSMAAHLGRSVGAVYQVR